MTETIHFWMEAGALFVSSVATILIAWVLKKLIAHEVILAVHDRQLKDQAKEMLRMRGKLEVTLGLTPLPARVRRGD